MRTHRHWTAGFIVAATLVGAAAWGQTPPTGFQLNRYEPTPAGDAFFAVEHPWYSSTRYFAGGITLNYNHNPLTYGQYEPNGSLTRLGPIVEHMLIGHVDLAGSFLDRVHISATLPITLYEGGEQHFGLGPVAPAVGDPRVGLRVRLWNHHDKDPIALSLGGHVWIPIGAQDDHAGDNGVRVLPRLYVGGVLGDMVRWSFNGGYYYRETQRLSPNNQGSGNTVSSEVQLGLGIGLTNARRTFNLGPEAVIAFAAPVSIGLPPNQTVTNAEIFLTGSYWIADMIQVGAGVGIGVAGNPGPGDVRALARIAYAPIRREGPAAPKDTDGDGIYDRDDACVEEKGVASDDPKKNGCPAAPAPPPDRDGDKIPDAQDQCPDVPAGKNADPTRVGCPAEDKDQDGVWDFEDKCPTVPAGNKPDPTRRGCPAKDSDSDGVYDYEDKCPNLPMGLNPDAERLGCPAPDRDGDSVPDATDACPDKVGAPDPDPKKNGCPGLVQIKEGEIVILEKVFFATNKDTILPKSFPVLRAVAYVLKTHTAIKRIAVEGHTDSKGKPAKNLDLSQRRAESVKRFLVQQGVEAERLEAHGYGQERPIADNKSEKGRAMNRRVAFQIVDPAPAKPMPEQPAPAPEQ